MRRRAGKQPTDGPNGDPVSTEPLAPDPAPVAALAVGEAVGPAPSPPPPAGASLLAKLGAFVGGLIAFFGFLMLGTPDGPTSETKAIQAARAIDAAHPPADAVGQLVAATGRLAPTTPLGDPVLRPGAYVRLDRAAEIYYKTSKRVRKRYEREGQPPEWRWTTETSSGWRTVRASEEDLPVATTWRSDVKLGALAVDLKALGEPGVRNLALEQPMLLQGRASGGYAYLGSESTWAPKAGDLRVWYKAATVDDGVRTVVGRLESPTRIGPGVGPDGRPVHLLLAGTPADALKSAEEVERLSPVLGPIIAFVFALVGFGLSKWAFDAWVANLRFGPRGRVLPFWGVALATAIATGAAWLAVPLGMLACAGIGGLAFIAAGALLARRPAGASS